MTEESARRRKKKFELDLPPTLLLSNVYFLNARNSKYILIGYSALKDFKPVIVFCTDGCFVEFILSDWITLIINQQKINQWFASANENEFICIPTKNIVIKNISVSNCLLLEIQNLKQTRSSNSICLNENEYKKCIELDSFIQTLMKNFQSNWWSVEDFYNVYVGLCATNKKFMLDDANYFYSNNTNIDSYRLFKEISYLCSEKLLNDVTHFDY